MRTKIICMLFLTFLMCKVSMAGVLPDVDYSPKWKELGHPESNLTITWYVDVNVNNIEDPFGDRSCVEYGIMCLDRYRDGMIYVYQMNTQRLRGRYIKRYLVKGNEIVDDYIHVEDWHDENTNDFFVFGRDTVLPIYRQKYRI